MMLKLQQEGHACLFYFISFLIIPFYLEDEHVLAHVFRQSEEASLGVVPRVRVQLLVVGVQRLSNAVKCNAMHGIG